MQSKQLLIEIDSLFHETNVIPEPRISYWGPVHCSATPNAVALDWSRGGGAVQQLNNIAGCRSRGPLETSNSGPYSRSMSKACGRRGAYSVGSKERIDGKTARDVKGFK